MQAKGQTFMPDYFASLLVFAVVIAIFLGAWDTMLANQSRFDQHDSYRQQAIQTTSFLVSTPGYPNNWEENSVDVTIVGFASDDHVLDPEKIEEFRSLTYQEQNRLLQTPNYYMTIQNSTDNLSLNSQELVFGDYYGNADTIVPFERNIVLNKPGQNVEGMLKLVIWS